MKRTKKFVRIRRARKPANSLAAIIRTLRQATPIILATDLIPLAHLLAQASHIQAMHGQHPMAARNIAGLQATAQPGLNPTHTEAGRAIIQLLVPDLGPMETLAKQAVARKHHKHLFASRQHLPIHWRGAGKPRFNTATTGTITPMPPKKDAGLKTRWPFIWLQELY